MKNMYPGTCHTCKGQVLPGQGNLYRDDDQWIVVHDQSCNQDPHTWDAMQEQQSRDLAREAMRILDDRRTSPQQLGSAVITLRRLSDNNWLDAGAWRERVMLSYAARAIDRLTLEELLDAHLPVYA